MSDIDITAALDVNVIVSDIDMTAACHVNVIVSDIDMTAARHDWTTQSCCVDSERPVWRYKVYCTIFDVFYVAIANLIFLCKLTVLYFSWQVEQDTAKSMQALLQLDTIKSRMEQTAEALQVSTF